MCVEDLFLQIWSHNEEILREIWNRIMKKIWSIIPTSLITTQTCCPLRMWAQKLNELDDSKNSILKKGNRDRNKIIMETS